jgi:transcriptional regulator with XRE-family HTH domain
MEYKMIIVNYIMTKTIFSKDHKILVERLKKAREDAGMNQLDVAKMLKKSQSYISKIESGQRRVDVIQLKNLASIYKKDINFFIKE